MVISRQRQTLFWGIAFALLCLVLWALGGTLVPFVLGAAIAYLLDPLADRLERAGLGRVAATAIIATGAIVAIILVTVLVIPTLISQLSDLVVAIPTAFATVQEVIASRLPELGASEEALQEGWQTIQDHLAEVGPQVLNSVVASSMAVVDFLVLLVVAPVVAFYLLLDWDRMIARFDSWLPREHADVIRRIASEIDATLAGFVRGQLLVCLIQGTFYALALSAIGLPFGFVVGMLAGLLAFIPYVGAIVGGVLSIGIAIFSFWGDWIWIVATWAIFQFGQFVEGNILTPKLVGKSVGLHPVVLLLALAIFGKLFGFAGMLVAVPVAATMGVISRFALEQYLDSPLYTGVPRDGQGQ